MKSVKNKLVAPPHQGISLFVNATVLTKMRNELIWPRAWIKRSVASPVLDKTIDFDSDKPNNMMKSVKMKTVSGTIYF
jgi:hypothetical protein